MHKLNQLAGRELQFSRKSRADWVVCVDSDGTDYLLVGKIVGNAYQGKYLIRSNGGTIFVDKSTGRLIEGGTVIATDFWFALSQLQKV
jgi:hypothetical protein